MGVNIFDPLASFLSWFLQQPLMSYTPVATYDYGLIRSLVVYREPPYQVELFMVAPGGAFPLEHRHPNIDSFEVHVWGNFQLTIDGKPSTPVIVQPEGCRPIYITRVTETTWHGASAMPDGAAFLSVQRWLNGVPPTSVGMDWEGQPCSQEQATLQGRVYEGCA